MFVEACNLDLTFQSDTEITEIPFDHPPGKSSEKPAKDHATSLSATGSQGVQHGFIWGILNYYTVRALLVVPVTRAKH
jgi:hypothetical protein